MNKCMDFHKTINFLQIYKSGSIQCIRTLAEDTEALTGGLISSLAIVANEVIKYLEADNSIVKTVDNIEGFVEVAQDPLKDRGVNPDDLISLTIDKLLEFLKARQPELFLKSWAVNGQETVTCTFPNLNVLREVRFYRLDGTLYTQFYTINGNLHRDFKEGPARSDYHKNGQIAVRQYREHGRLHRDPLEGPAHEYWHDNGVKINEFYCVDGKNVKRP